MQTIRWGLIGCGDVARKRVAAAIQGESRSKLVAACRRDSEQLDTFCSAFHVGRSYVDAYDLIADAEVDAVYLATPVREHLPHTLAAARAGKHVLVEKPMALSVAECDKMIDACRSAGVKLGVAYYRRYYPLVERVRILMQQRAIGTPMCVAAVTTTPLAMAPGEEGYWRVVAAESGGGSLMDIGSHRIDLFRYLFGEITDVKAICGHTATDYEAEETALLLLRFANGMMGTLQCHFSTVAHSDSLAIVGTEGRLATERLNGEELVVERDDARQVERHPPAENLCTPLIADFVDAILTGSEPRTSGEDGRRTNEVMENAYRNAGWSFVA